MKFTPREKEFRAVVGTELDDYDCHALGFLANEAPILNPCRPFCPLGKVTDAQARRRSFHQGGSQ